MRAVRIAIVAWMWAWCAAVAGCAPEPVGRRCDLGTAVPADQVTLASSSLDCVSRLCLVTPSPDQQTGDPARQIGRCTHACATDDDCPRDPTSTCEVGFACAPAVAVGAFACDSLCVCRDALDPTTIAYCATRAP